MQKSGAFNTRLEWAGEFGLKHAGVRGGSRRYGDHRRSPPWSRWDIEEGDASSVDGCFGDQRKQSKAAVCLMMPIP